MSGENRVRRHGLDAASRLVLTAAALGLLSCPALAEPPVQKLGRTAAESGPPVWPHNPVPRAGAPNVLLIMTDDVGFGSSSAFGGLVPTPTLDALAGEGVRYNQFNTTALCSPTRAALLTGREPHHVGMGEANNRATAYEGYTSVIPKAAGTVAETLREAGYTTAAFGKWHLTPEWEQSSIGPFDRWPTGEGFSYFYGFHGADTDQYAPALYENTLPAAPPANDPSYILDHDLAERTIHWIQQQHDLSPGTPFFVYYATGSAHSPHQAPKEWIDRFHGRFDQGWDVAREQIFARQKAAGIIPPDAKLTPRPDFLPAWSSLSPERKRIYARMMEAYAGALAYSDHEIGRVIDSLRQSGQYENTLIIFIEGDNGSSAEGGQQGLFSENSFINGYDEDVDFLLKHIDEIGGPLAYNHYPVAWAWAMNTPFQYYKQVASHFGGIRNGLVVSWPGHLKDRAIVRHQFHHVTDIAPTILEAAGVAAPKVQNGVPQMALDGVSMSYTFEHPEAPSRRRSQVFEMVQNLGMYRDGWMASTRPAATPWDITNIKKIDLNSRVWELYNINKDYSQADNLAASNPAKLKELQDLFFRQAARYKILPIHNIREGAAGRPTLTEGRTSFVFHAGLTRVPENTAPRIIGRSFVIDADVVIPPQGARGVLVTDGGRFGGYALYLKDGIPIFYYNTSVELQYRIAAAAALTPGRHLIRAEFVIDTHTPGAGGTLTLSVDGKAISSGRIDHTHRRWISTSEGFDVGEDTLTPINGDYQIQDSKFSGEIKELKISLN